MNTEDCTKRDDTSFDLLSMGFRQWELPIKKNSVELLLK